MEIDLIFKDHINGQVATGSRQKVYLNEWMKEHRTINTNRRLGLSSNKVYSGSLLNCFKCCTSFHLK